MSPPVLKVYGIIASQVVLTAVVAAVIYMNAPIQNFVLNSPAFQLTFAILPLLGKMTFKDRPVQDWGYNPGLAVPCCRGA